ncbi:MAG: hypothetical protein GF344_02025 [Chitinivibrionales bacterium]|nr:hypothetical protein [Chitinivibrionales bacterium]MBD3355874.1 hypothetical protein [Chitinivibrionales bacterium]
MSAKLRKSIDCLLVALTITVVLFCQTIADVAVDVDYIVPFAHEGFGSNTNCYTNMGKENTNYYTPSSGTWDTILTPRLNEMAPGFYRHWLISQTFWEDFFADPAVPRPYHRDSQGM